MLVVDTGETPSDPALDPRRDLMFCAEDRAAGRVKVGEFAPAGAGVLPVGTYRLMDRLEKSGEAGHRWARIEHVVP